MNSEDVWTTPTVFRSDLFEGQNILVTGGGSGIGRAVSVLAARLGANVIICGRTSEKLERVSEEAREHGLHIQPITTNIREQEQVEELFSVIGKEHGPLAAVVNNAGGQFSQQAIDFSIKGWKAVVDTNLNGTWMMMQAAAKHWRSLETEGNIVNIVAVVDRGMPGIAHTAAARAGVIAASRTVAVEWAPLRVRVNCLAPGVIASSGLEVYPPEAQKEFPLANPLKRPGSLREIAEAAIYLASSASTFMTGEVMTVDGGGRLWGELWTAGRPDYYLQKPT
ncbi:SDR family oxidoreductase [Limnohabitans sp. 2KL-51]|uniref:SDR family oxidoreductase n=1 Tax=Limnohabitans sp. 2KL-51 TaxID=1977911 RepID=UPI000D3454AE|nr:SDR family oxidoreductase [Limnohabitans sp. 2KL-51]PUE44402.1 short-chain dehydrogenase [Limnohabitans sp. 2KL-51]